MGWGIIVALFLSFLAFYFLFRMLRSIMPLALHGLIGIAIFWGLNQLGVLKVPIDLATFLIAAFGGVFGVLVVLALSLLGVPL